MNTLRNELKEKYSQIPNELITDLSLCSGSLRVLLYLFTKPDDWNVYNGDICKRLDISEQTLTKYWKILLNSGWLKREVAMDEKGRLTGGYIYRIGNFTVSIHSTESVKSIDYSNNKLIKQKETNTPPKSKPKDFVYSDEFNSIWNLLKTGDKWSANKSFSKRLKEGYTLEQLTNAIRLEAKKTFAQRHFSTTLNGDIDLIEEHTDTVTKFADGSTVKGNFI